MILLHGLDGSREEYVEIATRLQQAGFTAFAVDFRGHGASQFDWDDFSQDEFSNFVYDIEAVKELLSTQDRVSFSEYIIVGADFGANLALDYSINDEEIGRIVFLSPGFGSL